MRMRRAASRSTVVVLCTLLAWPPRVDGGHQTPTERMLEDGTRLALRLTHTISSATVNSGDPVNFEVAEDVEVNGQLLIKQGTAARGVVVEAMPKRRMGRAGKLTYALVETKTVDRETIRLRATQQKKSGDSNVTGVAVATTAVALFVPVAAPFFLLRKGKDITVAQARESKRLLTETIRSRSHRHVQPWRVQLERRPPR